MRRIVVLCMCLIALVLVGCSEERVWQENAVVYALEAEPSDLDPAMTTSLPESIAELQIFEGLTRLDKDNVPQPALAERWNVSDDGKTWTFVLRPGLVWSDGTAITADDFVYSWLRVLSPEKASENAYMLFCIDKAEEYFSEKATAEDVGIKALDHRTLQVRLKNPVPYFLNLTAFHCFYVVPRQAVEKNSRTWAATADFPCSGPFRITSWIHSGEIDFVKNEHYWDAAAVRTETLQFPISDSQATRLTMVESGQADMMTEPPPADEARLEEKGLYRVAPYSGLYYYVFNVTVPPFDDVRVRRAFAEAIERKNLVRTTLYAVTNNRHIHWCLPKSPTRKGMNSERPVEIYSTKMLPRQNGFYRKRMGIRVYRKLQSSIIRMSCIRLLLKACRICGSGTWGLRYTCVTRNPKVFIGGQSQRRPTRLLGLRGLPTMMIR